MLIGRTKSIFQTCKWKSALSSFAPRIAACALILSSHLVCVHAQQPGAESNEETFHRVVVRMQHGDFADALKLCAQALRSDPKDYRMWTLRGMAYAGLHDKTSAQGAFETALKIAPYYLPALEGQAQLQYQSADDSARPFLLRILTLRPNDPTTHAMLAVLDYRKKDCSAAVLHFQQAETSISTQPDGLVMYGKCLVSLSRYDEAIPVLDKAISLDPAKLTTRYYLALCQWNIGRSADALSNLKPLMDQGAKSERVLELAAGIYESIGESQHAIDLLRQAILANPKNPDAYLQFAELTYEHGSPKIGIDFLNAGLTQLPHEARFYLVRGVLLCQTGEFEKALEDFQTANQMDPTLSYVDAAKGIVETQFYKPKEALAEFWAAAKAHPDEALTQYLLAEALSNQSSPNDEESIEAAMRAVHLDPKMVAAQDLLAGIYLQKGEKKLAIAHSEAALAIDPNDQQALYHLALALRNTERKGEIPALIKKMSELKQAEKDETAPQKRLRQLYESPGAP